MSLGFCNDALHLVSLVVSSPSDIRVINPPFGSCAVEPMHKGEVLHVSYVGVKSGFLDLGVRAISPRSIERGIWSV